MEREDFETAADLSAQSQTAPRDTQTEEKDTQGANHDIQAAVTQPPPPPLPYSLEKEIRLLSNAS